MKTYSRDVSKIGDRALLQGISNKMILNPGRKLPIIVGLFYYILKSFFSVGAYIPKAIIRRKLGERTFGVITIGLVYLFLAFYQVTTEATPGIKNKVNEFSQILGINHLGDEGTFNLIRFYLTYTIFPQGDQSVEYQTKYNLISSFQEPLLKYWEKGLNFEYKLLWHVTLLFSLLHIIALFFRRRRGELINSRHRGKSYFSVLDGKSVLGFRISPILALMILDPLLVYSFASLLDVAPYLSTLAPLIKILAVFLLLEEFLAFSENRSLELDITDGIIEGRYIAELQRELESKINKTESSKKDSESKEISTVSIN